MSIEIAPLQGHVAQIMNARELVINIGKNHGVEAGMKFAVLSEYPLEIPDPNTGEILDTLDREKVRVEAVEIREKITICKTYRSTYIAPGPLFATLLYNLSAPPKSIPETLNAQDEDFPEPLAPEDSYVKIKDRVIQVEE